MNRYVIKGRGPNRGKYLGYARMAGLDPEVGCVWLPRQRLAARWENPGRVRQYSSILASKHDGYFVKIVAPRGIVERVPQLWDFIRDHAAGALAKVPCHWIHGANETFPGPLGFDATTNFCRTCALAKVEEVRSLFPQRSEEVELCLDGGFDIDHDSPPRCESCDLRLTGDLTEFGSDSEIVALTHDCSPVLSDAEGWSQLEDSIVNLHDDDPRWRWIARLVDSVAKEVSTA